MIRVWDGVPLHSTVTAALREADRRSGGNPVSTRDLLVALMHCDSIGEWHRIWLHCGNDEAIERKRVRDPAPAASGMWQDVQLTGPCTVALETSRLLAHEYRLLPLPAGILALGLIADHTSAASRALGEGLGHEELIRLVQDVILRTSLRGIHTLLPQFARQAGGIRETGSAPPAATQPGPPAELLALVEDWEALTTQFTVIEAEMSELEARYGQNHDLMDQATEAIVRAGQIGTWNNLNNQLSRAHLQARQDMHTVEYKLGSLKSKLKRITILADPAYLGPRAFMHDVAYRDAQSQVMEAIGDLGRARLSLAGFLGALDSFEYGLRSIQTSAARSGNGCIRAMLFFAWITVGLLVAILAH